MRYMFLVAIFSTFACFLGLSGAEQTQSPDLSASSTAAQSWLSTVDKGDYAGSWDQGSTILQTTMNKNEWVNYLNTSRKPLGSVSGRQVLDQRTAQDPKGLPPGDYMVLFYNTSFGSKTGKELLTLVKGSDGQWRVLTYQIKSE